MTDILFPVLSNDGAQATGVIVSWFVDDGAEVTSSTLVAEVAVDKVDAEIYPPSDGVIRLLVSEGDEVQQGSAIARLE